MTPPAFEPTRDTVRLFFALLPDETVLPKILAAAGRLKCAAGARCEPPDNYHVTLAFVGDVAASEVLDIRQIGSAQRMAPIALQFDAFEYWPKPELTVAAAHAFSPMVLDFWRRLHRDLAEHEWALAPKRFRPHVTLMRNVTQDPVFQEMPDFGWTARQFCLMSSASGGDRRRYTVVDTWPLLDKGGAA